MYHRRLCPKLLNPVESDECHALQKFWELDAQTLVRDAEDFRYRWITDF
jgi:hypothetical protein